MTATTTRREPLQADLPHRGGRAGFTGALRSEFTKIRSVRSTYWSLIAMIVITIGIGALASIGATHNGGGGSDFDPTQQSLFGLYLAQLVMVVLGAMTITSEYATGMIHTSLTAMPRRTSLFAAKAAVFAVVALLAGLIASFGAFFVGQAIMSGKHINATIGQPDVLRAVIGGGLFLLVCGMLAYGIGAILRHTAAAISVSIVLLFVLSILVNALPQSWQNSVDKWIPAIAGGQIWTVKAVSGRTPVFAPWTGFGVFCGYAAIACIGGLILFRRRDA